MKSWRFTCWALITLLLLYGGGVIPSLHKIAHHLPHADGIAACDHHDAQPTNEPNQDDQEPMPIPDDGGCKVCLGLCGLHLVTAPQSLPIVASAFFVESRSCARVLPCVVSELRPYGARAPPIC